MPSPAAKTINQVRFRLVRAETALREAIELARAAAALPDYCGPANIADDIERAAADLARLRTPQLRNWAIAENLAHSPVPRLVAPRARATIRQAPGDAASRR